LFQTAIESGKTEARKKLPVKPDENSRSEGAAQFRTTRWTVIMLAAQGKNPAGEAALAELYRLYWSPLYAFARYRGYSPQDAQDLTQGFFVHVIEHQTLTRADPLKGKFRSFLLGSFQKYLSVDAQRARCVKRGGTGEFVSLDMQDAESRLLAQPAKNPTPEKLFDAQWAMTLLGLAMARLREEYTNRGNLPTFEALKSFVDKDDSKTLLSYEQAAKLLGVRASAAKTLIHRFRKRYSAIVRQEIARTVSDPAEVDEEIHALCEALIVSGERVVI
jgi:DNA-directed RNA polymerase specialized sigma24 family protein